MVDKYDKLYNLVPNKLVTWNVPLSKRKPKILARLNACLTSIMFTYSLLLQFRKVKNYQLLITPQVCYLEKLLNDKYDYTLRRIRIGDPVYYDPIYIFIESEAKPVYLPIVNEQSPLWLYTDGETGLIKDDFIVFVPLALSFDEKEMRAVIDSYRLAGKKYKIEPA